jgi:hypothetical protein
MLEWHAPKLVNALTAKITFHIHIVPKKALMNQKINIKKINPKLKKI